MKIKHIEILECVESRTLFKILGRHRAIRELNKGKLSLIPHRNATGERSIMYNVNWSRSKNTALWAELYVKHEITDGQYGYERRYRRYLRKILLRGQVK